MKYLSLILVALISFVQPISAQSPVDSASIPMPIEQINSSMNMAQKRVREAAVKISTAQHVTDGPVGSTYHVFKGNEVRIATLLWSDADADMAVLRLTKKFVTIEPMKWNPQKRLAEVGTTITYSGYPSDHKLMTFAGSVAGYADKHGVGKQVIVNTYGWFGCSGSVVYTMSGEIVGILYGVDVEYYPDIQVQENMIWVVPIQRLQIDVVLKQMCREFPNKNYRACR